LGGACPKATAAADVTGPINISNPAEFSIRELAEIVIGVTGSRSGRYRVQY
jgi:UDP-glucuronate decarboxylase